jgi:hypothetical protein
MGYDVSFEAGYTAGKADKEERIRKLLDQTIATYEGILNEAPLTPHDESRARGAVAALKSFRKRLHT